MSWDDCTLGDVVTLKRGHDLPKDRRKNGDIPVVSSSGITGSHNEAKAQPPGVVTGRYGTIGEVFYLDEPYWPLNTALYAIDFHGNSPQFVAYFLRNLLKNYKSEKAAVPGVDRNVLHKIGVRCPDTQIQNRIVSVLSAYDDLIENNQRRIALLEEAARLLYREWFVHSRFPGAEHVKVIDGVPEGWEQTTLYDCVEVLSGGTPKTTEPAYWGDEIPFFTPKDTGDGPYTFSTEKMITEEGLKKCNSRLYDKNTLFITARGTVGKIRLAQRPMAMNQSCYAMLSKTDLDFAYLYFAVTERVNHLKSRAGGAVFDAIVIDTFKKIPFLKPNKDLTDEFSKIAGDNLKQIDLLSSQIRQAQSARDLLLPRLMDGRLEI